LIKNQIKGIAGKTINESIQEEIVTDSIEDEVPDT
jgi:hypothetical protein